MMFCHAEVGKTYLILSFEYQDIGYTSEGDAQMDDLCLSHLIRDVANVDHLRRFSVLILVQLHLQQTPEQINRVVCMGQIVGAVTTIPPSCIRDTEILNLWDALMTPIFLRMLRVYLSLYNNIKMMVREIMLTQCADRCCKSQLQIAVSANNSLSLRGKEDLIVSILDVTILLGSTYPEPVAYLYTYTGASEVMVKNLRMKTTL
jgi:hypothetical protein